MAFRAVGVVVVATSLLLGGARVGAAAECDPAALCPGPASCTITGTHNLSPACALDFGGKAVTLVGVLQADETGESFEIRAGSLDLNGGKLRSVGTSLLSGGTITIQVTGAFVMRGSGPLIDVSAGGGGGDIDLTAASISVQTGFIRAEGGSGEENCDDGGTISLTATGPVLLDGGVVATTPGYHCAGGDIGVTGASIEVRDRVDTSGGDLPGDVVLDAIAGDVVVTSTGTLAASGKGSDGDGSGASAGAVEVTATGSVTIAGDLVAIGTAPDGDGGDVSVDGGGDLSLSGEIDTRGNGSGSGGGDIALDFGGDVSLAPAALLRSGADLGAGAIDVFARGDVISTATLDVRGGEGGAGDIAIDSGDTAQIGGTLYGRATAGGSGGSAAIFGCLVDVSGLVDVGAAGGGSAQLYGIDLTGGSIVVRASADLLAEPCPPGIDCVVFGLPAGVPTVEPGAVILPAPELLILPALKPCCGNGALDAGETCDDGNRLSCDGCTLSCVIEASPPCPPDGNECTQDCRPTTGCAYDPLSGVACSDEPGGNACTQDVCQSGTCTHPPVSCNDGIACTVDSCDPGSGCSSAPNDAACTDGSSCTADTCDPATGCEHEDEPDGTACSDLSVCTTGDRCEAGVCVSTGSLNCDDGSVCTDDSCHPTIACLHIENAAQCPCSAGGDPLPLGTPCADGASCSQGDTCDGAGVCVPGPVCDDGDPCSLDGCLGQICLHADNQCPTDCSGQPDGAPCSDGLLCTDQTCQGGACVAAPKVCGDSDPCNGSELCIEAIGCTASAPPVDDPFCAALDHFTCYKTRKSKGAAAFSPVPGLPLEDAFEALAVDVTKSRSICNPTNKDGEDPGAPAHEDHLQGYEIEASGGAPAFERRTGIVVTDQFGTLTLDVIKRERLLVPAAVDAVTPPAAPLPPGPDHFQCYKAKTSRGTPKFAKLTGLPIEDAFGPLTVDVKGPSRLCLPANKDGEDPGAPSHAAHLLCYKVKTTRGTPKLAPVTDLFATDQLGTLEIDAIRLEELCLPATLGP